MTSIFLFSLVVGGSLLALSLLGDVLGVGDADLDAELDLDTDLSADADVDGHGSGTAGAEASTDVAGAFRIFTVRNLTYFLFGFGGVGWLLTRFAPELPVLLVALSAILGGGLAAGLATALFGWLKVSDAGWTQGEGSFVGCQARVVLPLGRDRPGQIMVRRDQREHELRALPFDPDEGEPEQWRSVVVVEMAGGTARVTPLESLAPADGGSADT